MKFFLLLMTVFLLAVDVNSQCYDVVQQYFQCKNLKMIKSNYSSFLYLSYLPQKYKPNPLIDNNELTDRFYRKLVSNDMNFDKAMKLFRRIYTETEKCTSEFCKCVSEGVIDLSTGGNYSVYFRNEAAYPHVKNIIEAFNKKFESKLLPYSELKYRWEFSPFSAQNLSSLAQFCINHDYSKNRLRYYNASFACDKTIVAVTQSEYDCLWDAVVENKTMAWGGNFTNSQLGKLLICQLKNFANATTIEEQRFCALSTWATAFPQFVWNKDMITQLDSLVRQSKTYEPRIKFASSDLHTYSYLNKIALKPLKTNYSSKYITDEKFTTVCFNSKSLRIDCEWTLTGSILSWNWANFTFIFDEFTSRTFPADMTSSTNPFEIERELDLDDDDDDDELDFTNSIIKDKLGENWIEMKQKDILTSSYFYLMDFNSNITVVVGYNYVGIITPKTILDKAEGLMVDGFPELEIDLEDDRRRKRRSVTDSVDMSADEMSCQAICDQATNTSPITNMDFLIESKAAYNKCLNDCFLPKDEN